MSGHGKRGRIDGNDDQEKSNRRFDFNTIIDSDDDDNCTSNISQKEKKSTLNNNNNTSPGLNVWIQDDYKNKNQKEMIERGQSLINFSLPNMINRLKAQQQKGVHNTVMMLSEEQQMELAIQASLDDNANANKNKRVFSKNEDNDDDDDENDNNKNDFQNSLTYLQSLKNKPVNYSNNGFSNQNQNNTFMRTFGIENMIGIANNNNEFLNVNNRGRNFELSEEEQVKLAIEASLRDNKNSKNNNDLFFLNNNNNRNNNNNHDNNNNNDNGLGPKL